MSQQAANWDHCLEHAEISDIGLRRANNQDSVAVHIAGSQELWRQRGHLFMVADGMGAHAAGELASKLATGIVAQTYHKLLDRPAPDALVEAVRDANSQIYSRGQASEDFRGMGTTLSALAILPEGALVAQVGDSRIYRLRGGRFEQLSFDHSLVWELRATGRWPGDDVPNFIPKNIITRCLGPNPEVQVDLEGPFPIEPGDVFLLCSDGLSGQVKDEEIGKVLTCLPLEEAVRALVHLANLNGGPDNITVAVARITGPQVATGDTVARPLRLAPSALIPGALWGLAGLLILAGLVSAIADQALLGGLCLAGAVASGVVAWFVRPAPPAKFPLATKQGPLGRGPYARADSTPDAVFVERLASLAQRLRNVAANEQWSVDWPAFNAQCEQAQAASGAGNHCQAVVQYCHAIDVMMDQVRTQRGRKRFDLPDTDEWVSD
jgi:protein phosphatase